MVKRGDNLFGDNKFGEFNYTDSYNGSGRVYYENLKDQKVRQQNIISHKDNSDMPFDESDYNAMFMSF